MFPDEIAKIAVVAIKNEEFKTLNYLLSEFWGWTDSPDGMTARAAMRIGDALFRHYDSKHDVTYLRTIRDLYAYATHTKKYFEERSAERAVVTL